MNKNDLREWAVAHRSQKAKAVLNALDSNTCGNFGNALELYFKPTKNNNVAGHDTTDIVRNRTFTRNGVFTSVSIECKTNGGRINNNILENDLVIYTIDICNSTTKGKHIEINTRVLTAKAFVKLLEKHNAIKKVNKGGLLDGNAIQVSKRGLWGDLEKYSIEYNLNQIYALEDIEKECEKLF